MPIVIYYAQAQYKQVVKVTGQKDRIAAGNRIRQVAPACTPT